MGYERPEIIPLNYSGRWYYAGDGMGAQVAARLKMGL